MQPDGSFEVDGKHVVRTPDKSYGFMDRGNARNDSPLWKRLRAGIYVQVTDDPNKSSRATKIASEILIRDDWDEKLSGFAVIVRQIAAGAEPVFEVDGYRLRIGPSTLITWTGNIKVLADVKPGLWVRYQGRRNSGGELVADKVTFLAVKPPAAKPLKHWEDSDMKFRPPGTGPKINVPAHTDPPFVDFPKDDAVLTQDGGIRLGMLGGLHAIPADNALQARVRRVGMSLVPAYQRQLAPDDPARIPFHFYAVDLKSYCCGFIPFDGMILIPRQAVERLKNDDQLAAVLADGIACDLQEQIARATAVNRALIGTYLAGDIAEAFIPGASLLTFAGGATVATKGTIHFYEQRVRIALALMADAGYDPRQAPEAWKLIIPKKLPKDLSKLKYPDYSLYYLNILSLQYGTEVADSQPAPQ